MEPIHDDLEEMMSHIGDFGRYQAWQFILHVLAAVTAGMHMLSLVTVAAVPEHRCMVPEIDNNLAADVGNPYMPNVSADIMSMYIPLTKSGALDSCHLFSAATETNSSYDDDGSAANRTAIKCSSWTYDNTYHQSSRAIEWNLVCDRRWMGAVAQSAFMFGVFTGAVVLGGLADKVGRKKIFCWSATLQLVLGVVVAYVPEYYSFLVVRFFYGMFGSAGSYITGFVLTMEIVGPSVRTVCGIAFQVFFAVGIMLDAGWGSLIKDRTMLQTVYGLHGLLLFGHWWLMDESPRWLWAQGRTDESVAIVSRAVAKNGRGVPLDEDHYRSAGRAAARSADKEDVKAASAADLFRTPNLKYRTLNMCLCWFANSLVYYGLSLSTGKLQGNPFLVMFLMGLVEMPSYAIVVLLLDRLGRRALTSSMMLAGGVCCICGAYMTPGTTLATAVIMSGKFFIAGSFAIVYNYSAELFPTVVRNTALGIGSMCARAAATFTPLITLLDSFDPTLPAVTFALIALLSGFLTLLLPETMGRPMPQSLEDGERFGAGDTCFSGGLGRKRKTYAVPDPKPERIVPLQEINSK